MSHATEVAKSSDEMIRVIGTRESGIIDYAIGHKISVSWRGLKFGAKRQYFCGTCRLNECVHTRRIDKYRGENFA